jgi:hypothetical protein
MRGSADKGSGWDSRIPYSRLLYSSSAWLLVSRRGAAQWRLRGALLLGILVAATLLASVPIYTRAMADLGLSFAIRDKLQATPSTDVEAGQVPLASPGGLAFQKEITDRIQQRIGWFTGQQLRFVRLPAPYTGDDGRVHYTGFTLAAAGAPVPQGPLRPRGVIQSLTGYEQHVRVTAGRLPQVAKAGAPIEVALPTKGAQAARLKPGDSFQLADSFDNCERHPPRDGQPPDPPCTPTISAGFSMPAVLTGTIEPLDPKESYWRGQADFFFAVQSANEVQPLQTPVFVPEATLYGPLAAQLPYYPVQMDWYSIADPAKITSANEQKADAGIIALRDELLRVGVFTDAPLEGTLSSFRTQLSYTQTPLLLLLLQVAGIALFYVAIVAATVVERQVEEIALLRSRGASLRQVLAVYLIEGLLLSVPAVLIAPFLATRAVALLGKTPTFNAVTHGAALPASVLPLAFPLALAGAALSLLALLFPAFLAARRTGVTVKQRQARPRPSIIRRYYLDLVLVGFAALLLLELRQQGSVYTPGSAAGLSSDPLLLLSPALFTLAAAALILRFYPLILRLLARLIGGAAGTSIALGLWQMVRNAGQYTRLGLLLMMAVSVGTFAASYSGTATRSFRERVLYSSGVDLRALEPSDIEGATGPAVDQQLKAIPGVADSSSAVRVQLTLAGVGQTGPGFQLLGVEPTAASRLLWSRPGLGPQPLPVMLEDLRASGSAGIAVPGRPVSFSIWANPTLARQGTTVWARFLDGNGQYEQYELGLLNFTGWHKLTASLMPKIGDQVETPAYPLTLASVIFTEASNMIGTQSSPVYLDDFSVADAAGHDQVIEDFEGSTPWSVLQTQTQLQDQVNRSSDAAHSGSAGLKLTFRTGSTTGLRGIYPGDPGVPLPAIASTDFLHTAGIGPGGVTSVAVGNATVPVRIVAVSDLFPTLDPADGPFLVVNRDAFLSWANRFQDAGVNSPNEGWVRVAAGADRRQVMTALAGPGLDFQDFVDEAAMLHQNQQDPLVAAGGSGILLVAFIALLVLIAVAFVIGLIASIQRRRIEFAVVRVLGLRRRQLLALLAFEYAVVAVLGIGAGLFLGRQISGTMLSFLDVTETGRKVVPPFVLTTNWAVVLGGCAALLVVFLIGAAIATRLFLTQREGSLLRNTE